MTSQLPTVDAASSGYAVLASAGVVARRAAGEVKNRLRAVIMTGRTLMIDDQWLPTGRYQTLAGRLIRDPGKGIAESGKMEK